MRSFRTLTFPERVPGPPGPKALPFGNGTEPPERIGVVMPFVPIGPDAATGERAVAWFRVGWMASQVGDTGFRIRKPGFQRSSPSAEAPRKNVVPRSAFRVPSSACRA